MNHSSTAAPAHAPKFTAASRFFLGKRSLIAAVIASMVFASSFANAATDTWNGASSTDWKDANWTFSPGTGPVTSGDALVFTSVSASGSTLTNTLTSSTFNIAGITFNAGAQAYTMTGNTFNLTAGITNNSGVLQIFDNAGGVSDSGTGTQSFALGTGGITITNGLSFSGNASQTLGTNGAGTLTLGSLVLNSGGSASTVLSIGTIPGSGGNIVVTGAVSNGGSGANGLKIQSGAVGTYTFQGNNSYTGGMNIASIGATVVLTGDNTAATGTLTVNAGTLDINSAKAIGSTSSSTLALGASLAGLYGNIDNTNGGVVTVAGPNVLIAGTFSYGGTNSLNLGNNAVSSTASNATIALMGSTSSILTLGVLTNSTAGNLTTLVAGSGHTLNLSGYVLSGTAGTARTDVLGGSGNVNITGAVTDVISGAVSSGLTYSGSGTLTLAGANTYSGATTVNSGTVLVTGSLAPANSTGAAITVSGGQLVESGTGVIGGTATTLTIRSGAGATLSGANTYGGATTVSAGGMLTLDYSAAGASSTNIINGAGTVTLGGGTLLIKGASGATRTQSFGTTNFSANTSSNIVFNQNGASGLSLVLNTGTNLFRGAQSTVDFTLPTTGTVTTGATAYASNGILVAGATAATDTAYATVNGGSTWATNVGGVIGGLSSYATGPGSYTSTNNVDVTNGDSVSGVTVNTLRFNAPTDSLALSGANTVATGGILVTPNVATASITGATATLNAGTGKELVIINDGIAFNIGAIIADSSSGSSALTLAGTGTTTLAGANTYSGATSINSGTVILAGSNSSTGTTQVNTGGTLVLDTTTNDGGLASGLLTLAGGTLQAGIASMPALTNAVTLASIGGTISGAQNLTLGTVTGAGNGTLTSSITGGNILTIGTFNIGTATTSNFTLTINGSGNTSIGVVNDFSGGSGTTHDNLTYSGSGTLSLTGASLYGGTTTVSGGTLMLAGSLPNSTTNALTFNGTGIFDYNPSSSTAQTLGKLTFNTGAGTVETTSSGQVLTFTTALARSTGATGNFVIGDGSTASATNGFVITGQAAGFINQGTYFNGSNFAWYDSGGFVRGINYLSDTAATTTSGSTTLATTGNGGATLLYAQTTGKITAQATQSLTTLNLAGTSATANANDFVLANNANLTVKGILRSGNSGNLATISGGAGITPGASGSDFTINTAGVNDLLMINTALLDINTPIVKTGLGTLFLGTLEVGTDLGSFIVDQGTLNITQDSNFGVNLNGITLNAGTLQAGANNISLNGLRTVTLGSTGAGQTIDTQSNNMSILGSVVGGGTTQTLAKTGSGTLTLAGASTYASTTAVNAGTLLANNTVGSATGTGSVNVASAATLGGSGIIAPTGLNTITVAAGGTLAPGTTGNTNTLTLSAANNTNTSGMLALSGAKLAFNLGAGNTASSLSLTSAFANEVTGLSGNTLNFTDLTAGGLALGEYTLFQSDDTTTNPFSGLNAGVLSGYTFTGLSAYSGDNFQLELNQLAGGYAIQLDITAAVPEPSTWAMMLGGLAVLFLQIHRKKRVS